MQLKLRTGLLIAGCLLTLISMFLVIGESNQLKLLVILLVALGVPHGALDLYIERKNLEEPIVETNAILRKYLLNIIAYALLWYFMPVLALGLFILITAYHFGEIDWMGKTDYFPHRLMYFLIGLSWILYFLAVNVQSAIRIFLYLGNTYYNEAQWLNLAQTVGPVSLGILLICHLILFLGRNYFYHQPKYYYYALFQLIVLLVICHLCPLWLGFGFYFGLWHSLLSFDKIRINFKLPSTRYSWGILLKKAMPFSIMAWIGMLFIMFMFYHSKQATSLISLLFITLSVLTLPHLQVFTKLKIPQPDPGKN